MMLYHFTFAGNLIDILGFETRDPNTNHIESHAWIGIRPSIADFMTAGRSVVWLTSRNSMKPTPADLEWLPSSNFTPAEREIFKQQGNLGDRTAVLTVGLSGNGHRLHHYGDWLRKNSAKLAFATFRLAPSALTDWWIYFGTIPANRITDHAWTDAPSVNEAETRLKAAIDDAFGRAA
jgi:hypothetical protein